MNDFILSAFADEAAPELSGQLAALKRNRIPQIEIRNLDGKCVIDLSDEELARVRQTLDENGITVSAIGSPIGKISITEAFPPHFDRFRRAVAAAKILGTRRIRMFSFFMPKDEDPAAYQEAVVERLKEMCEYAAENGVFCCHENEKEIYGDTADRVVSLHEAMGEVMKGIFDPANYIQCGEDPGTIYPRIAPYVDYLHVKDALKADGSVVPAGMGDGSLGEILRQFRKEGETRLLTIEPHLHVFKGLNTLQGEELRHRYSYESADAAFDAACQALRDLLSQLGYTC